MILFLAESFTLPGIDAISIEGKGYYVLCAILFLLLGLILGYFIWRKGHMQMLDAETEVRRTRKELDRLRDDLKAEQTELGSESVADP